MNSGPPQVAHFFGCRSFSEGMPCASWVTCPVNYEMEAREGQQPAKAALRPMNSLAVDNLHRILRIHIPYPQKVKPCRQPGKIHFPPFLPE